jgi:hypothetical protein
MAHLFYFLQEWVNAECIVAVVAHAKENWMSALFLNQ